MWLESAIDEVGIYMIPGGGLAAVDLAAFYENRHKVPVAVWERLIQDSNLGLLHPKVSEDTKEHLRQLGVTVSVTRQEVQPLDPSLDVERPQWPSSCDIHVEGISSPSLLAALGVYWLALNMEHRAKCWDMTVHAMLAPQPTIAIPPADKVRTSSFDVIYYMCIMSSSYIPSSLNVV